MSTDDTIDPQHWHERTAQMRAFAVRMAGCQAAILINDLAVHYEELADRAADKSRTNGKRR